MRLKLLLPLAIFAVIAAALYAGLSLRPRDIPSALIGKPVPAFELPPLEGREQGLAAADLATGEVTLVNVFASWCAPCRIEHPLLIDLQKKNEVRIVGINYKDQPQAATRWLAALGDPYSRIGADLSGRAAIEWGVYGVPETFLVTGDGRIACKQVGPLTPEVLTERFLPMIRELKKSGRTSVQC